MDRERWRLVDSLFLEALELEEQQREAFLDLHCGQDLELKQEVQRLLAADRGAGSQIAAAVAGGVRDIETGLAEGQRVGSYEIVSVIGKGGMGIVYRARRCDDVFLKDVAIKVVKRGMDTVEVLRRFQHERRILARLDHPNIARILDGGSTDDGLPYLVMEFVEGTDLLTYCNDNHLGLVGRLKLLLKVCEAIESAHRNLIVHRDLKPGNILVDGQGSPRLLDFGIAKLLEDSEGATLTMTTQRPFTPRYAAPEQVTGEPVSVATDVYSLGVVLFELLTSCPVYRADTGNTTAMLRAVLEEEPRAPSQAARAALGAGMVVPVPPARLKGDLDRIVLMALEKDPRRRYGSVRLLADDLRRYLDHHPVLARPQSFAYRARKYVRRNGSALTAAALIFLSLIGGIAYSSFQAHRAEARFQQVRSLANTFVFDVHDAIESLPGSTKARRLLVSTGLTYLDNLAAEAGNDPELQWELAQAYTKLGSVQGAPRTGPHLGDTAGALESRRKAAVLLERLASGSVVDIKILRALADNYMKTGDLEVYAGRQADALTAFRRSMEITRRMIAIPDHDLDDLRMLGFLNIRMGDQQYAKGENALAFDSYRAGLEDFREYARLAPFETGQGALANGLLKLARAYGGRGEVALAVNTYRETVAIREELARRDSESLPRKRELAVAYSFLAEQLFSPTEFSAENRAESLLFWQQALSLFEEAVIADPDNAQAQRDLMLGLLHTARALEPDDPQTALGMTERAESIGRTRSEADTESSDSQRIWIYSLHEMASRLAALHRFPEALESANRSLSLMERVVADDPDARRDVVEDHQQIGDIMLDMGEWSATRGHYEAALALAQTMHDELPRDLFVIREIADSYERLGRLLQALPPGQIDATTQMVNCPAADSAFKNSIDAWNTWGEAGGAEPYRLERQRVVEAQRMICS